MEAVAVVTGIAVLVIAIVAAVFGIAYLRLAREIQKLIPTVERILATMDREAAPTLQAARKAADQAGLIVSKLSTEVEGLTDTSRDVRKKVARAVESAEERLLELEDLLDILQDEVEETVLSVAGTLRASRRGASVFGAVKRAILGRKRSR